MGEFREWALHEGKNADGVQLAAFDPALIDAGAKAKAGFFKDIMAGIKGVNSGGQTVQCIGKKSLGDGSPLFITHYKIGDGPIMALDKPIKVTFDRINGNSIVTSESAEKLDKIINPPPLLPRVPELSQGGVAVLMNKDHGELIMPSLPEMPDWLLFHNRLAVEGFANKFLREFPRFVSLTEPGIMKSISGGLFGSDRDTNEEVIAIINDQGKLVTLFAAERTSPGTLTLLRRVDIFGNTAPNDIQWRITFLDPPIAIRTDPAGGLDGKKISEALDTPVHQGDIARQGNMGNALTAVALQPPILPLPCETTGPDGGKIHTPTVSSDAAPLSQR